MSNVHEMTYKLIPLHLPKLIKNNQLYTCAEKFRINSNKALSDVWLIYKSDQDNSTWNLTIYTRMDLANAICPNLYYNFMQNDLDTVWKFGFDIELIKRNGGQMSNEVAFSVEGPQFNIEPNQLIQLNIVSDYYMNISIKNALKAVLKLGSDKIVDLHKKNIIQTNTKLTNALGKQNKILINGEILKYIKTA